jgi:colanic acid biosynthesis glycosyl transferase WcaI
MKILIYSANFAPEPTGIGKYSGEMASWLADQGHQVRVICAPPYYPNWKLDSSYAPQTYRRESMNGIDVWRAPIWIPKSPGGFTRVLHLMSFAITSLPIALWQVLWRPDLVVCVAPALVCAPAGLLTARLSRSKAWLHLQDFEVDMAFRMGLLKGKQFRRAILWIERAFLRRFEIVSSISARMVELLLEKGVSPERSFYFPNWVDVSKFDTTFLRSKYREQLGIASDAKVVLFSGSLGGKQGLMVIPEVANRLQERTDIVFVICGDGLIKPALEAATKDLPNVRLLPLQPLERLGELLGTADIHLLPQSRNAADLVLPSKLSGMLASGRPVIATCDEGTEINSVVSQCGLVVPPEDVASLSIAICKLVDDDVMRLELGRRARKFADENFEFDRVLTRMFAVVNPDPSPVSEDSPAVT